MAEQEPKEDRKRLALHRTIVVVDVEGFGAPNRNNRHQVAVRDGLYRALVSAFEKADIEWSKCRHEDRGDGVLILAPPDLPKSLFAELLPGALVEALRVHNSRHPDEERIRLRMALNAGDVTEDENGVSGTAVNLTFRLVEAPQLKTALADSKGLLAVISSSYFYDDVMRHSPPCDLASFRQVHAVVKETDTYAWICRPDDPYPPIRPADGVRDFERRYLNLVAAENATFELFQVGRSGMPVGSSFDEFYVMPPITRRLTAGEQAELTGTGTDPGNAIAQARRVLLLGGAGAGKTTFLRWLAHVAASTHDSEGPWRGVVPFYVSLRYFPDPVMPQRPGNLLAAVAPTLTGDKLSDWADELFTSGRAMLLVDGLDELVVDRRNEVMRWLERFVRTYPEARYVVSTRPSAVDDTWFLDQAGRVGLIRFELLSLSTSGLARVIQCWYAAARDQEADQAQQEWLGECESSLRENLATRPNLRSLVASPLLAALLCALYRQNNQYLPRTRRELLDQSLDLLLGRWDDIKLSSSDGHHSVAVEEELRMTKAEQLILLERFAAPMVRGSELMVSHTDAQRRLERAMHGLRSHGLEPAKLLQHMLVRTGLLREYPAEQKVQFVHRTFRDYLAAADMVKAGELETLVENAHKDSWYEVVFMAAAQAREREVADLLQRLLRRAVSEKDQNVTDRLVLVAAACLGYADVVYPDQVRIQVQNAAHGLIPPASFHNAEMLAKAGPFVLDLLPGPDELGPEKDALAAFVIRTLAMIGGEEAWEKIRPFTAMHQSTVVDELLRGWREFDFDEQYARFLLSQVDFGDRVLEVRRWGLLPRLKHLTSLTALKLIGNLPLADTRAGLYPLADLADLRSLDIVANETIHHLAPLIRCRNLRSLRVSGFSALQDVSALAKCAVDRLALHPIARTTNRALIDLATLAGARLTALSIQHPRLAAGLHPLPDDLPLVELEITNRAEQRSLLGVDRWPTLEQVTANGVPREPEVEALAELPRLRHLVLHVNEPAVDLERLRPLVWSLDVLELYGVKNVDAAFDALGEDAEAELRIHP
ncbi:NACHT domain-containing protein [Actinocrispum wychmicini]|uniref:NACHT domain-containing protein n=1 Tax=Actinocrispum wychmicini TaxID=1213861 RepID=A0A4V2S888_9PSEU|nr:NACHT domain-containing protein [Actinocrispum wychmicini]TCO62700.1 NACHT domain-containing protein [Actinocrispum wychmicini]